MSWEFLVGQYRLADRCVRSLFCIQVVQLEPPASAFTIFSGLVVFALLLRCCFFAWMRTAILAGGIAVVRSGFCFCFAEDGEWLRFVHWRLDY